VLRGFLYLPRLLGILCCGRGGGCRCSFMLTRCLPRLLGILCCGRGLDDITDSCSPGVQLLVH